MPFARTDDGVNLHYEETGAGAPIIFVHEFAADHRSWEMQMRHFGQRYRAITYGARGYPPSDVPEKPESYSQERATDDILAVMDHLGIDKAHVVGLSMGGFASLHFGFRHPTRARSLVVAGVGYGAEKHEQAKFKAASEKMMGEVAKLVDPSDAALDMATYERTVKALRGQFAKAFGATKLFVSDLNDTRLALAREILPEVITLNPKRDDIGAAIRGMTEGGVGCDVALECVGNEKALQSCLEAVRKQGTIVQVGLHPANSGLHWHTVTFKDVDIRGSWAYPTHLWPRVIDLIASGAIFR